MAPAISDIWWVRRAGQLGLPLSLALAHTLHGFGPERVAGWTWLRCPLHATTGLLCPTCGLGRSLTAAWMGRYHEAWNFHFLGPVFLGLAVILWIFSWTPWRDRPLAWGMAGTDLYRRRAIFRGFCRGSLVVYILWGFSRNLIRV